VQAAKLTLGNKDHTHYTEGPLRWDGIKNRRNAEIGQFAEYSDCSSFATWCLWNGLVLRFPACGAQAMIACDVPPDDGVFDTQ
jgi:hypothetical protein